MKIKGSGVESFVRKPLVSCVLVYGPDYGLVQERTRTLVESVLGKNATDPFQFAELSAAGVAADPALLADEAGALSFGGGRRVVRVRAATDGLAQAFANVMAARAGRQPEAESLVIADAGDLGARSALRLLFEESPEAAALPCYVEEGDGLTAFVGTTLRTLGHRVDRTAVEWIGNALGGDRAVVRGELEKLSLYVGQGAEITVADAAACLGDSAEVTLDDAGVAAVAGDIHGLDRALARSFQSGATATGVLRAVGRHLQRVHQVVGFVEGGVSAASAMAGLRPPVFFKQKDAYESAIASWNAGSLARALELLADAELECKRANVPDEAIAWRAVLRVASAARRGTAAS